MSYGPVKRFYVTMASAGTTTAELNLDKAWATVYLEIPTMTSNTQFHVQAAVALSAASGLYRRVKHPSVNTSTVAANNDYAIHSSVTNAMVPIPAGFRHIKIETTATVDSGQTFMLICMD